MATNELAGKRYRGHRIIPHAGSLARGIAWLALAGLVTACGGGGGSDDDDGADSTAPIARILFPPAQGVTEAETITVTGTASDAGTITLVRVNGVDAASSDGFATWRAQVPLAPGVNQLTVETGDQAGNMNANAAGASLLNQPVYTSPSDMLLDAVRNRLVIFDLRLRALLGVDLVDSSRIEISGPDETPAGIAFSRLGPLAYDGAGDRYIVAENATNPTKSLHAVDPATGVRSVVSSPTVGGGSAISTNIRSIAFDDSLGAGAERVLVLDDSRRVYAVDLASGVRSVVSEDGMTGSGDPLFSPQAVVVDPANDRALVNIVGGTSPGIVSVDLATGDRTLISPGGGLSALALDAANERLYAISGSTIVKIILTAGMNLGDRSTLSGGGAGSGPDLFSPNAIVLDAAADRLLVADNGLDAVVAVDIGSGDRNIIDDNDFGSGVAYNLSLVEIELDPDSDQVFVYDRDRILRVGLDSGVRTIVTDDSDFQGNQVGGIAAGIALDLENNQMLVATDNPGSGVGRLIGADLTTGDRSVVASPSPDAHQVSSIIRDTTTARAITVISTPNKPRLNQIDLVTGAESAFSGSILGLPAVGAGDDFQFIPLGGIALDVANDRVLVMQDWGSFFRLFAVDLATGDRSLALLANEAPEFGNILGKMVLDTTRNRLLILDERNEIVDLPAVVYIDLDDDSRATLSNADIGEGVEFRTPRDIAFHPGRDLAVVLDRGLNALVAVDLESGDRVLFSK